MSDEKVKIEPSKTPIIEGCPCCGGECVLDSSSQAILCTWCMYRSGVSSPYDVPTIDELVIDHNQHCEYVKAGKRAKKVMNDPRLAKIFEKYDRCVLRLDLADAAEKFLENPPTWEHDGDMKLLEDSVGEIFEAGVQACLDFFQSPVGDTEPRGKLCEGKVESGE